MFDWLFPPTCPVDPAQKAWIEKRVRWLTQQFGLERICDLPVILPAPEFFPEPYKGTKKDVQVLLKRVCEYMDIDPERVALQLFDDGPPDLGQHMVLGGMHEGAAGLYEEGGWKDKIKINRSILNDPQAVIGTMAHELGHVHLLSHGRISSEAEDHEPLTDLLTVFLGLGIFTGNSVIREAHQVASWSISRQGYLTMPMYGYAFALFAWIRGEDKPAWARHLRGDVYSPFKQGLRYLLKTEDSLFKPLQLWRGSTVETDQKVEED